MHLPDGLLSLPITITLWIAAIIIIVFGFFKMGKMFEEEDSDKLVPYIGVLGAVIFAFQFVNYPVPGGTSGHLIGATLIAVILGPWASVILLLMVLILQSLFGDGGLTAIGPNTFNMGIIAGIFGFYLVKLLIKIFKRTSLNDELKVTISTAIGSYIALVFAAFVCGLEIGLSGEIPMNFALAAMTYWHLLIGIGEAIISGLIVYYIIKVKPDLITTVDFLGGEQK